MHCSKHFSTFRAADAISQHKQPQACSDLTRAGRFSLLQYTMCTDVLSMPCSSVHTVVESSSIVLVPCRSVTAHVACERSWLTKLNLTCIQ